MTMDRYTKLVLTVIATALVVLALNPWIRPDGWDRVVGVRVTEAQTPAAPVTPPAGPSTPPAAPASGSATPAAPQVVPGGQPIAIPAPGINTPWWEDCAIVSKETVPASWGKLLGLAPGVFVFESDDTIRLVRTAPFEAVPYEPAKKPCKILEIKKVP